MLNSYGLVVCVISGIKLDSYPLFSGALPDGSFKRECREGKVARPKTPVMDSREFLALPGGKGVFI
jgi:hypothetical protein